MGPETGNAEEFKTFEELWEAYRKLYQYVISACIRAKDVSRYFERQHFQLPFVSSIDDGCMELGDEALNLSEQPNGWHNPVSSIVAADSLVAIKKLIWV